MRIIGIDPGLAITGVSVLEVKNNKFSLLYCDCIVTSKNNSIQDRLNEIFSSIDGVIKKYLPDFLAIEEIFFSINAKSAIKVGQAKGVCILAGSMNNLEIFEYTPLQVKQAIVGYGRATKKQIKYMLQSILNLDEGYLPKKDDAWDALAICICHANNYKFQQKIKDAEHDSKN